MSLWRQRLAGDAALRVVAIVSSVLALVTWLVCGFTVLVFGGEVTNSPSVDTELGLFLLAMVVLPGCGTALLFGYWRALKRTLHRRQLLWVSSLLFNTVVLAGALTFISVSLISVPAAVWTLFVGAVSVARLGASRVESAAALAPEV